MKQNYEFYTNNNNTGGRVHPRNWMYRVASWTATFENKKLIYNELLMPVICDGRCCLRINNEKLKEEFPEIYKSVMNLIIELDAKRLENDS